MAADDKDLELSRADGETWESYARRLELRVGEQRRHLGGIAKHGGHRKRDAERIAKLERLLGRNTLALDERRAAVAALAARVDALIEERDRARLLARNLFPMIDRQTWRDSYGDAQGLYEGDVRAAQIEEEIEQWEK